jgi:hypothetical protein
MRTKISGRKPGRKEVRMMAKIPFDEIAGFLLNGQVVCPGCVTENELANLKEDEVITWQSIEDAEEMVFCDRGKERL